MSLLESLNNPAAGQDPDDDSRRRAERVGLTCVVALAALFVVATLAGPGPVVLAAALAFAFAAAAWVLLLYGGWKRGALYLPSVRSLAGTIASAVLVGAAGVALTAWTTFGRFGSILVLVALLVGYLGIGLWILRWRFRVWRLRSAGEDPWGRVRAGLLGAALLVLLVTAWVGAAQLGDWPAPVAGALLGVGVAPLPAVLGVLAEQTRDTAWVASRLSHWWFRAAVRTVAVALVVLAVLLAPRGAEVQVPATWALALLALLVVAIVSATLVDIAVVLLVLALMGVAAPADPPLEDPWPQDEKVLVALGDSYLSGEGAEHFVEGTDDAGSNECRRARTAWPVQVARRAPFDGLVFLACSGARTYNLRLTDPEGPLQAPTPEPQYPDTQETQLDDFGLRYAATVPDPALVVLSLGGNDVGFATIGLTCLAPGSCDSAEPKGLFSNGNMTRVANRLRQAYADVRSAFPSSPVVVIPYPDPIYDDPREVPCGSAFLKDGDVVFVKELLTDLNRTVAAVAEDYGFYVADTMASALADSRLQLCDPANHGRAGINFVNARSVGGVSGNRFNPITWKHGSLHPNERGHAALARAFETWLTGTAAGPAAGLAALQDAVVRRPKPPRRDRWGSSTTRGSRPTAPTSTVRRPATTRRRPGPWGRWGTPWSGRLRGSCWW